LPRPPNGSDREYGGNNGEFGGGSPIGPGGQQSGQRGPQNQIPQGQPPFLIGGRGGGRGGGGGRTPPNGVGILVGQAKTGHFHVEIIFLFDSFFTFHCIFAICTLH
jgi:hypothetical protein